MNSSTLNKKNIPIRKKWGQNFLIDDNVIKKIIRLIKPEPRDTIIEIGPGKGALTLNLSNYVKKIYGIEIDPLLFNYLDEKKIKNLYLINEDILKWNTCEFNYNKVVGNIPYNISSQIIIKFIKIESWDSMVLMMQKELAERIISNHGRKCYGRISVMVQTYCDIKHEFNISKNVFIPKPKVDSSILSFKRKATDINFDDFSTLIKESFKHRRKKLKNNLKNIFGNINLGNFSNLRAEELSIENFHELYKKIYI